MCYSNNYAAVLATGLATGVIYSLLVFLFHYRDRRYLRKAPYPRLRYFLGLSANGGLICHEDVRDPVLLSCGHIYCASCIMPLIKEITSTCAYCSQKPHAAHDMRLKRIAIMQPALNITQCLDLALKCYIGGLYGFPASITEAHGAFEIILGLPLDLYFNGLEYWWKGKTDCKKREERRKQLPASLRWTQDMFDQVNDGWDWRGLIHAVPIAVSWSLLWAVLEEQEELQEAEGGYGSV